MTEEQLAQIERAALDERECLFPYDFYQAQVLRLVKLVRAANAEHQAGQAMRNVMNLVDEISTAEWERLEGEWDRASLEYVAALAESVEGVAFNPVRNLPLARETPRTEQHPKEGK